MDNAREFLDRAIEENQLTIRAIDVKIAALMAGTLAPLSATGRIFKHLEVFAKQTSAYAWIPNWIFVLTSSLFVLTWFLAFASMARGIGAIDNPVIHIPNAKTRKGTYYGGGLFKFSIWDAIVNRTGVMANKGVDAFIADLPKNEADVESELAFEHMKLIYIREAKLNRLTWGFRFAVIWVCLGSVIYLSRYQVT